MSVIYTTAFDDAGADGNLNDYGGGTPNEDWVEGTAAGAMEIDDSEERVEMVAIAADRTGVVEITGGPTEEYAAAAVVQALGSNFVRIGVVVRGANNSNQGYLIDIVTNNNWELWRNDGSFNLLDSGAFTVTRSTQYEVRATVTNNGADTDLQVEIDDTAYGGTPTFTDDDADDIESGAPGLWGANNTAREGVFDSFEVDDLAAAGVPLPAWMRRRVKLVS